MTFETKKTTICTDPAPYKQGSLSRACYFLSGLLPKPIARENVTSFFSQLAVANKLAPKRILSNPQSRASAVKVLAVLSPGQNIIYNA